MYPKTKLGNVLELHRGYDLPERERVDGNVPIISSSGYSGCHNEYKCEGENVITGRYGTIGEVFFHEGKCWPLNTALYVSDYKGNYPKYIYYLLKYVLKLSTDGKDKSTVPGVDRNVLHQMNIPFCEDIDQQRQSIKVLENLDGRIKINKKVNDNLQHQLKLMYDYWFTQFDFPDESGKPYCSSGGQMEWDKTLKRNIPVGWSVMPIIDLTHIYQSQTISNDLFDDSYPYYVYGGGGLIGKYSEYNHINEEVIISCRGNCGNIFFTMPCSWITGNAMVVSPLDKKISKHYLYQYLKSYGIEKYISGSVQKQLTRENLSVMPIIVPPDSLLNKFNAIAQKILIQQQKITEENAYLMHLRDWLLPMLMNGQATISD